MSFAVSIIVNAIVAYDIGFIAVGYNRAAGIMGINVSIAISAMMTVH